MRLSAARLGRKLAKENGEDTQDWDPDEFAEYFFDSPGWRTVFRVSWRAGSFAGVVEWRGFFYSYDDAGRYGPYRSFREARAKLQVDAGYDEIIERWVESEFVTEDRDR